MVSSVVPARRSSVVLLAALALLCLLAALPGLAGAAVRKPPVERLCAGRAPQSLTLRRDGAAPRAELRWRAPRKRLRGLRRYSVLRDGIAVSETRRRSLEVPVQGGERYRFAVVPKFRSPRTRRCAATLRVEVAYQGPGSPGGLAVGGVTQTSARLTWAPAPRGDGAIKGYRVFRDGALVREVDQPQIDLSLSPARSYALSVVAVDERRRTGARSRAVTLTTPRALPSAPGTPTVRSVGVDSVSLSWPASRPGSGPVTGYRVYRDGTLVTEVAGTSAVVGGLAEGTAYAFTVVAVDDSGATGPAAPPTRAATIVPSRGHAHAVVLTTDAASAADLRAHYLQVGTIYPTYYDCTRSGGLTGNNDAALTAFAQERRIRVLPRVNCAIASRITTIVNDATVRARFIDQLLTLVRNNGFDGLDLDFTNGNAADRDALTRFAADLAARLHGLGRRLTVSAAARSANRIDTPALFYDHTALLGLADHLLVTNWGAHSRTSAPGGIDDLAWATENADWLAGLPGAQRVVLGMPLHGMDWPADGGLSRPGSTLEWDVAARLGGLPVLDPASETMYLAYVDASGVTRDAWFPNAGTYAARVSLARSRGLALGLWRLGHEDPGLWSHPGLAPGTAWP